MMEVAAQQPLRKATCFRDAARTFADSLYARLPPYNITSLPSTASLMASIVLPINAKAKWCIQSGKFCLGGTGTIKLQVLVASCAPAMFVRSNHVL